VRRASLVSLFPRRAPRWVQDVPIAVNVAAANLLDVDFPKTVGGLLRAAGIAPDRLCNLVSRPLPAGDLDAWLAGGGLARALATVGDERDAVAV